MNEVQVSTCLTTTNALDIICRRLVKVSTFGTRMIFSHVTTNNMQWHFTFPIFIYLYVYNNAMDCQILKKTWLYCE
jgi:hypothetical protein